MSVETIMAEARELPLVEMQQLHDELSKVVQERSAQENAAERIDSLNREAAQASGRKMGDPWVQPTGATDAYPTGEVVEHEGRVWRSLVSGNVWEPGVSGWREISEDEAIPPPFTQPTGAHDAYNKGDRVRWENRIWRSKIDGNVWSRLVYPEAWAEEGVIPEELMPSEEPEEPTDPTYPEWTAPTGGHDAYSIGDEVLFEGTAYRSVIDENTWSPAEYPAGWEEI